ncbi:DEAD/DEAH box helicase [Vibrio hippocampi]|uniref:ATP-dependent RNA helicase RhlE n=1 Tax=Vibrio hippocampi TaxID=654686 RepID=A0ABM8ZH58_9VIBR|nr:DEAD/DEAH box helicase [Vibrio hippocampi]CAH0526017.1 ATP-dependent RNA helicase RhlE [Vibrio hippocampi]
MPFNALGLSSPIVRAITDAGYQQPTPIQAEAIPAILQGKDVMAEAQTGTGKTAGFMLPILERLLEGPRAKSNHIRTLVLTPTRELAAQIYDNTQSYSQHLPLRSQVVFGGVKANPQMMELRKGSDVLVATPGRLLDLYSQNAIKFSQLEVLVLDEADRMLDMGFIRDINKIIALLPKQRQNLLFSATFNNEVRALAKTLVNQPVEISVTPPNTTAKTVEQSIYTTDKRKKAPLLVQLINENDWSQVLVFCRTKHGANRLSTFLDKQGISSAAIHGNKSQGARTRALQGFKQGEIKALVATDIAARGIDISQLPCVVNYDLPNIAEDYVHRIGRTGRAGEVGVAISLVCDDETSELFAIERLTQALLLRKQHPDFVAVNEVPESKLDTRPFKPKKPKKPNKPKQHKANEGEQGKKGNTRSTNKDSKGPNTSKPKPKTGQKQWRRPKRQTTQNN